MLFWLTCILAVKRFEARYMFCFIIYMHVRFSSMIYVIGKL